MIDGFTIPVHRSLTEEILMGGAPRAATILNGTIGAALGLGLHQWVAGFLFWFVAQGACVFAAKRDPKFFEVLIRHVRHKGYLA